MFSVLLAITMVIGVFSAFPVMANASNNTPKTSNEAVSEMTWGMNLSDLYMSDIQPEEGAEYGYDNFTPKAEFGLAAWFWDYSFDWLCYHDAYEGSFDVEVAFPAFGYASAMTGDLFKLGVMVKSPNQYVSITLSNSRIVKSDQSVIALSTMNQTYTGLPHYGPDVNGWSVYNISAPAEVPEESADLNGAKFCTTVTVNPEGCTTVSKTDYYFQLNRTPIDQEELTDVFLKEGANVFRLPVTWTWFADNHTFALDQEWLDAVKTEVDYILSRGAYCILNMHNDYMKRSFVAEQNPETGEWENFKWTDKWMDDKYDAYVDARFAAIWTQIAEYFKDYSDHLIFETCNEPTMEWYYGVDYNPWIDQQEKRVNELNALFVDTVRQTGGKNDTRLLCLAVAEYNIHTHLDAITVPEDSDYLMIQIHSYNELESTDYGFNWKTETDALFSDVAAFQKKYPKVPVLVGEVGISHSWTNLNNKEAAADKVAYFYGKAEALGVPCLWWEDYFPVSDSGADHTYWLYDKTIKEWGRPEILKVIQDQTGTETQPDPIDPDNPVDPDAPDDPVDPDDPDDPVDPDDPIDPPDIGPAEATGYYHAHGRQIVDPEGNPCVLKGISFGNMNYGNPSSVEIEHGTGVRNDHDANSYYELAAMGLDHVRFEFNYGLFEDDDAVGEYKQSGFDWIDENIAAAKAAGIKLILQMKSPQGGYQMATNTMYGPDSGGKALWIDLDENGTILSTENYKENQERLINLWRAIAERYQGEPAIIGYGLLNEPAVPQKTTAEETVGQWKNLAQRIANAIREVDNNHILFVEPLCSYFLPGNYAATDWNLISISDKQFTIDDTNSVYEFHFYEPLNYTHQGADWMMSAYGDCFYDGSPIAEPVIKDWNSKGMADAYRVSTDGEWFYFESDAFSLADSYNVAQPQINMSTLPAYSSIWVDDLLITRTNIADGTTETVFSYDFTDHVGGFFKVWNGSDDYLAIALDSTVGHNSPGAMKLTNNLSTMANQWANAQSSDSVILEEGYTYKISGYVKGRSDCQPRMSFLSADAAWLMNKSYLNHLLDVYCAFGRENHVPLHVGEWGFHYNCYDKGAEAYIRDLTALFEEKGLSSNYHSYHDSSFGLYLSEEYAPRPSRNETLYNLLITYYCTPTGEESSDIKVSAANPSISYKLLDQSLTVTNNRACVVTYQTADGQTVALPAESIDDGSYRYNVPEDITDLTIDIKGDYTGNGDVTVDDAKTLQKAILGKITANDTPTQVCDINNDGRITAIDLALIAAAALNKYQLSW